MDEGAEEPNFRRTTFDRDYWLCRCEGFRVFLDGREVGVVAGIRFQSRLDRPDLLVVRGGFLRSRSELLSVERVTQIKPELRRLELAQSQLA